MNWQATRILINVEDDEKNWEWIDIDDEYFIWRFFLFEENVLLDTLNETRYLIKRWMDTPVIGLHKCKLIEFDYL